jgi:hypothetical protein
MIDSFNIQKLPKKSILIVEIIYSYKMQKNPVGYVNTTGVDGIYQFLEQTNRSAGLKIQVDAKESQAGRQAWNGDHIAALGVDETRPAKTTKRR